MITDQNQTGIPSRNRVQLVKPTQTYNTGRVQPQTTNPGAIQNPALSTERGTNIGNSFVPGLYPESIGPTGRARQSVYNVAPAPSYPAKPSLPPEVQAATDRGEIYNPIQPKGYVDPLVTAANAAQNPTAENINIVNDYVMNFEKLTRDEQYKVLQAIAEGSVGSSDEPRMRQQTEPIIGGPTAPIRNR